MDRLAEFGGESLRTLVIGALLCLSVSVSLSILVALFLVIVLVLSSDPLSYLLS